VTEFEGHIWLAQDNDEVNFICTTKRLKHKIQAVNEKGRELRLAEDKLLWQYPHQANGLEDWQSTFAQIQTTVAKLRRDIDIALLWESAGELQLTAIEELAELYFGQAVTIEHLTALWRSLAEDRLYFKRRGKDWEARSAEQIAELTTQRNREHSRAQSQALAKEWLQILARSPLPAFPHLSRSGDNDEEESGSFQLVAIQPELLPFIERLESWLRGDTDKDVEELVTAIAITAKLNPRELVFETLQKIGRLPLDADRDVIVAGLKPEFSTAVNEAAQQVLPWQPNALDAITPLLFSIDDEETREVDDALAIEREGTLWKIIIAIANPASVVHRGDTLDREAMRRGTTVYLPTQTVLMLPERISCDIASLTAAQIRSSLVIRAWLNEQGEIVKSDINREGIKVLRRLHYSDADQLLNQGEDETAQQLRQLLALAKQLQSQRLSQGALTLQRPEYKVTVTPPGQITVTMIAKDSPSRLIVAEMMILANHLAARYAQYHQISVIYRCQDPPLEPVTEAMLADPLNFHKIRKLLGRSSLSLQPGAHTGLGLSLYTQLTSPLRRFADLVIQRQLMAHLVGDELPYDQEELFKVLETAERTARESRLIEGEAKKRWLMQYLKQNWSERAIEVLVVSAVKNGYKVEMQPWAVEAFLSTGKTLEMGQTVMAVLEKIRVKAATARLKLVKSDE
jgi:exoribonuclease-2